MFQIGIVCLHEPAVPPVIGMAVNKAAMVHGVIRALGKCQEVYGQLGSSVKLLAVGENDGAELITLGYIDRSVGVPLISISVREVRQETVDVLAKEIQPRAR